MKRHASSDSLGALISICPLAEDEQSGANKVAVYGRELECVMEEEAYMEEEETGQVRGKKRRLSAVQVKALEKKFEVENKLEPERKVKLALELGLQPRQVAVWFQNRRARWKTKQLERDYGVLKATYDSLKDNFDSLHQANQLLLLEIAELKTKMMNGESVKEAIEEGPSDSDSSAILNSPSGTATHPAAPLHQYVKMEEHDFFSEETCNFYSEDQAPTLHWWTSTSSLLDQD